jgi:hypothetical protein
MPCRLKPPFPARDLLSKYAWRGVPPFKSQPTADTTTTPSLPAIMGAMKCAHDAVSANLSRRKGSPPGGADSLTLIVLPQICLARGCNDMPSFLPPLALPLRCLFCRGSCKIDMPPCVYDGLIYSAPVRKPHTYAVSATWPARDVRQGWSIYPMREPGTSILPD